MGKANVGGVDYHHSRMRFVMQASLALSTAPQGFTASDLSRKVGDLSISQDRSYTSRQAAYDLKKLRGKQLIEKIGSSHRYRPFPMTGLVVLRDKVIKPVLASCCSAQARTPTKECHALGRPLPTTSGWHAEAVRQTRLCRVEERTKDRQVLC